MNFQEFRDKIGEWLDEEYQQLDHGVELSLDDGKTWTELGNCRVRVSFQKEWQPPVNGGAAEAVNKS